MHAGGRLLLPGRQVRLEADAVIQRRGDGDDDATAVEARAVAAADADGRRRGGHGEAARVDAGGDVLRLGHARCRPALVPVDAADCFVQQHALCPDGVSHPLTNLLTSACDRPFLRSALSLQHPLCAAAGIDCLQPAQRRQLTGLHAAEGADHSAVHLPALLSVALLVHPLPHRHLLQSLTQGGRGRELQLSALLLCDEEAVVDVEQSERRQEAGHAACVDVAAAAEGGDGGAGGVDARGADVVVVQHAQDAVLCWTDMRSAEVDRMLVRGVDGVAPPSHALTGLENDEVRHAMRLQVAGSGQAAEARADDDAVVHVRGHRRCEQEARGGGGRGGGAQAVSRGCEAATWLYRIPTFPSPSRSLSRPALTTPLSRRAGLLCILSAPS